MTATEKAVSYFTSVGWTPAQAAGIVANLHAESGLRPDAVGDGGLAYGIAQWHPDRQQRFITVFGKPIVGSSLDEQLAFVHAELTGSEKVAGDALRACVSAGDAGACVSKMYERPADREGEAAKRAILAVKFAGTQPAAPIEDRSTVIEAQPQGETGMGAGLLMALVQTVIGAFAPLAQQKMSDALTKHGGDPAAAGAIVNGVINAVATATGTSAEAIKSDPKAAIAAVNTVQNNEVMIQQVEQESLASLDKLAPVLDKLHQMSKEEWVAEEDSKQAAFERNKEDPAQNIQKPMMTFTMFTVGLCTAFTGGLLGWQMYLKNGEEPNGQLIILFVMLVTTFVNMLRTQNDWGFGSSKSSAGKDETIKQMAKLR